MRVAAPRQSWGGSCRQPNRESPGQVLGEKRFDFRSAEGELRIRETRSARPRSRGRRAASTVPRAPVGAQARDGTGAEEQGGDDHAGIENRPDHGRRRRAARMAATMSSAPMPASASRSRTSSACPNRTGLRVIRSLAALTSKYSTPGNRSATALGSVSWFFEVFGESGHGKESGNQGNRTTPRTTVRNPCGRPDRAGRASARLARRDRTPRSRAPDAARARRADRRARGRRRLRGRVRARLRRLRALPGRRGRACRCAGRAGLHHGGRGLRVPIRRCTPPRGVPEPVPLPRG